jgi:hypothetical protein
LRDRIAADIELLDKLPMDSAARTRLNSVLRRVTLDGFVPGDV